MTRPLITHTHYSHSIIAKMLLVTCYFSIFITIFAGRYLLIILGDNGPVGLNE